MSGLSHTAEGRPRTAFRLARRNARGRVWVWPRGPRFQRTYVNVSYARNRRDGSWANHGRYLGRAGAQRDGAIGHGFNAEHEEVDLTRTLRQWQRAGDRWFWKIIVSPEHGDRLDLRAHTRELVAQMEQDLATPLEWAAIDHHNTDTAHVHVIVRGRDDVGRPLEIAPNYFECGVRMRSRELATRVLGFRSEREQMAARGQAVERLRFTGIDSALLLMADHRHVLSYGGPRPSTRQDEIIRSQDLQRLRFLERLGLAEKTGAGTWRLASTMESDLTRALLAEIFKKRAHRRALARQVETGLGLRADDRRMHQRELTR